MLGLSDWVIVNEQAGWCGGRCCRNCKRTALTTLIGPQVTMNMVRSRSPESRHSVIHGKHWPWNGVIEYLHPMDGMTVISCDHVQAEMQPKVMHRVK